MKRWHEEKHIAARNLREYEQSNFCGCKNQLGRYRKQDAHDCGKPECGMCHGEKVVKAKSYKAKLSDLNYNEQKSAL